MVAEERDRWRGSAVRGRERAATVGDEACQRNARVRVVDPQGLVAEDLLAQLLTARVARDRVGGQRVQVNDERVGNEGVEEDLDAGTALERATLRQLGRRTDGVFARGELFGILEGVQKGRNVERDQVFLAQGCERDAAGLDKERVACFRGGVSTA